MSKNLQIEITDVIAHSESSQPDARAQFDV